MLLIINEAFKISAVYTILYSVDYTCNRNKVVCYVEPSRPFTRKAFKNKSLMGRKPHCGAIIRYLQLI